MKIIKLNNNLYINANNLISIEGLYLKETDDQDYDIYIKILFETYMWKGAPNGKVGKSIDIKIGTLSTGSTDSCVFCPDEERCPFTNDCENCDMVKELKKDFIAYFNLSIENYINCYIDEVLSEELTSDSNIIDFTNFNLYGAFAKSIDLNSESKAIYEITTYENKTIFKRELGLGKYKRLANFKEKEMIK